jgi:epoxyqueuosine reductase
LAKPLTANPWAKSIVVCLSFYGKYDIPRELNGRIGKAYLCDARLDAAADGFKRRVLFERFLGGLGLRYASESKRGLTAVRWAAQQAGLGIIRRNNFLYTEYGSWVTMEVFLIDRELELLAGSKLPPCPANCDKCRQACPTRSLSAPYCMNPMACVSRLTTRGDFAPGEGVDLGGWLYGCDLCQDACPMNRGKWTGGSGFPGLAGLGDFVSAETILASTDAVLTERLAAKFWYIEPGRIWKWKVNAINAMNNAWRDAYAPLIAANCRNGQPQIREMALWVARERGL